MIGMSPMIWVLGEAHGWASERGHQAVYLGMSVQHPGISQEEPLSVFFWTGATIEPG